MPQSGGLAWSKVLRWDGFGMLEGPDDESAAAGLEGDICGV